MMSKSTFKNLMRQVVRNENMKLVILRYSGQNFEDKDTKLGGLERYNHDLYASIFRIILISKWKLAGFL